MVTEIRASTFCTHEDDEYDETVAVGAPDEFIRRRR
jgi:hypothetical protein